MSIGTTVQNWENSVSTFTWYNPLSWVGSISAWLVGAPNNGNMVADLPVNISDADKAAFTSSGLSSWSDYVDTEMMAQTPTQVYHYKRQY